MANLILLVGITTEKRSVLLGSERRARVGGHHGAHKAFVIVVLGGALPLTPQHFQPPRSTIWTPGTIPAERMAWGFSRNLERPSIPRDHQVARERVLDSSTTITGVVSG